MNQSDVLAYLKGKYPTWLNSKEIIADNIDNISQNNLSMKLSKLVEWGFIDRKLIPREKCNAVGLGRRYITFWRIKKEGVLL